MSAIDSPWIEVCPIDSIPPRGCRVVRTRHMQIALFRTASDEVFALENRCPAKVCPGLIRYSIVRQTEAVAAAAPICPTGAIVQQSGEWRIDDAKCIRCHACKELAPDDIHLPGVFVQRVVPLTPGQAARKDIEKRTTRGVRPATDTLEVG